MPVTDGSLPALLKQRADQQADTAAYTFIDYGLDPNGFAETLTWSQVYGRACVIAEELKLCGAPGDRVAILAPQGLEYVIAFLGALQAGFIAVPLSTPQYGIHDDRVSAVLRDSKPVAILTTSSVVSDVTKYATAQNGQSAPFIIEVDLLDLDSPRDLSAVPRPASGAAYLQYTSGSTRTPAGVIVSHKNVIANVTQSLYGYFGDLAKIPNGTVVSWLPLFHDMGLILGICAPMVAERSAVLLSPMAFLRRPACWMQLLASNPSPFSAAPNFAFELAVRRTSDEDMAGLDLSDVVGIVSGSERIHVATVKRFTERFAKYNLSPTAVRPSYGLAEATLYVAAPEPGTAPTTVRFDYEHLTAGQAKRCGSEGSVGTELISYGCPDPSAVRIVNPDTMVENMSGDVGEIWVHGDHVALGYWQKPEQTNRIFNARIVDRRRAPRKGRGCAPGIWACCPKASCSSWAASRTCSSSTAATTTPTTSRRRSRRSPAAGSPRSRCRTTSPSSWWRSSSSNGVALRQRTRCSSCARSNVRSPPRFRAHTACGSPIWSWCPPAPFPSPPAARSDGRPALSDTAATGSSGWT